MHDLLTAAADMRKQATVMKDLIVGAPSGAAELREALYELEAAIYVMERAAADAYRQHNMGVVS